MLLAAQCLHFKLQMGREEKKIILAASRLNNSPDLSASARRQDAGQGSTETTEELTAELEDTRKGKFCVIRARERRIFRRRRSSLGDRKSDMAQEELARRRGTEEAI